MLTTRTLKTIGASLAASTLLLVAGCSSEGEINTDTSATAAQGDPSDAPSSEEAPTEMPDDMDFSQLLDGITYKGEQVVPYPQEQLESYVQEMQNTDAIDESTFDPPECAEEFMKSEEEYLPEKMSPKTFTIGDLQTDGFSVVAYHRSVTKDPLGDKVSVDLDKCENYTYHSPAGSIETTIEQLPFKANADKGYAIIQHSVVDGMNLDSYNTLVEKNGAIVNINLTVPTEENIKAADETLNMILERL